MEEKRRSNSRPESATSLTSAKKVRSSFRHAPRSISNYSLTGPFSASNVPASSFLTVRAIWPERKPAENTLPDLLTNKMLRREYADCAQHLLQTGTLGLGKLDALMDLICTAMPSTPIRTTESLGDRPGPFAHLVSFHNLLNRCLLPCSRQYETPARLLDAPRPQRFDEQRGGQQPSPVEELVHRRADWRRADHDLPAAEADTGRGGLELPPIATTAAAAAAAAAADASEADTDPSRPAPRSPTETLVMDLLITLLSAIAAQIQPSSKRPDCIANAFEQTLRFGSVPGTDKPAAFRARTDGGISFSKARSLLPAIIFGGNAPYHTLMIA